MDGRNACTRNGRNSAVLTGSRAFTVGDDTVDHLSLSKSIGVPLMRIH